MKRCTKCGISLYDALFGAVLHDAVTAAGGSISGTYCEHEFKEAEEQE